MEELVLVGGFFAIAAFGYYVMTRLDPFLEKIRAGGQKLERTHCLKIATSDPHMIPIISRILGDMSDRYSVVPYTLLVGQEQEILQYFDSGSADVAIVSPDVESDSLVHREPSGPGILPVDRREAELKSIDIGMKHQKVLWNNSGSEALVLEFVQQLCAQKP